MCTRTRLCWYCSYQTLTNYSDLQLSNNRHIPVAVAVAELQCLVCIFEATVSSPIRWRASMIAFHVGSLPLREQQISISCLQRAMSPRKVLSIALSSWPSSPNFTPSECQSTTASSAFESSFRVGVAGAVSGEITSDGTYSRRYY